MHLKEEKHKHHGFCTSQARLVESRRKSRSFRSHGLILGQSRQRRFAEAVDGGLAVMTLALQGIHFLHPLLTMQTKSNTNISRNK